MAVLGDIVECNCGAPQQLVAEDLRIRFHKRAGQDRFDCKWSGATADRWEPISRCLGCGATDKVRNTVAGAPQPYGCLGCGRTGTLLDFIDLRKLKNQPKPEATKPPGKHRYQEQPRTVLKKSPPKCPSCASTNLGTSVSDGKYAVKCLACGHTLGDAVVTRIEAPRVTGGTSVLGRSDVDTRPYVPVTPALKEAVRRATEARGAFRPVKSAPAADRNIRSEMEEMFHGKLEADVFDDVFDLSETFAKRALLDFLKLAKRDADGNLRLDATVYAKVQDVYSTLEAKVADRRSDEASDLAYLTYFGMIEKACKSADVAFRREDITERGL